MNDSERISVVLPTQAKKELEKLCDIEKRSISNFVYSGFQKDEVCHIPGLAGLAHAPCPMPSRTSPF